MRGVPSSPRFRAGLFDAACLLASVAFFALLPLETLRASGEAGRIRAVWAGTAMGTFQFGLFALVLCIWFFFRRERGMLYFALSVFFGGGFVAVNAFEAAKGPTLFSNVLYSIGVTFAVTFTALYFREACEKICPLHRAGWADRAAAKAISFLLFLIVAGIASLPLYIAGNPLYLVTDVANRCFSGLIVVLTAGRVCACHVRSGDRALRPAVAAVIAYGTSGLREIATKTPADVFVVHYVAMGAVLMGLILFVGIAMEYAATQKKLLSWNAELEAAVALRTAELAKAEEGRRDMIANMAHDLRTPAAAICGAVQLLEERCLTPESEPFVRIASQRSRQLTERLDTLFDLARLEAGIVKLEPRRMSAVETLRAFFAHYDMEFAGREEPPPKLSLDIGADAEDLEIEADFNRLWQIFDNLVSNAVKHAAGPLELTFGLRRTEGKCVFFVGDNGKGIAPGDLERVFERTFMASRSREGGSGLGLSIVKSLVEMHGGHVWAESAPGRGSRFSFALPALDARADA